MQTSNLTPLAVVPTMREASSLKSQREPDSLQKVWKFVSELVTRSNVVSQNINQINRDLKSINSRNVTGFDLFPFKIYSINSNLRPQSDIGTYTGSANWRTVRVRSGLVLTELVSTGSFVNGTDRMEQYSYNDNYGSTLSNLNSYSPNSNINYDIQIPLSQSQHWFWIEQSSSFTSGSNYYLRHSATPTTSSISNPNPWLLFPIASATLIPIGYVDTNTSQSIKQAFVRQMLTTDVISSGGNGITWRGLYDESASYSPNDEVFVDPNLGHYTLPFQVDSSSFIQPLCGGDFICKVAVPSAAISGSRNTLNYWYPIYPPIPTSSVIMVSGSMANQVIWDPVSPMFLSVDCDYLGNNINTFKNGVVSGSTFDLARLPYIP